MDQRFSVEHPGLLAAARTVLEYLGSVENRLQFGDAESMWHRQWAHRAASLHGHLSSALGLAESNEYPAALALIRVALEHHLIDRLMFLGTATVQTWTRGDVTVGRYEASLEKRRLDDQDLVTEWSPLGTRQKRRQYRVVLRSPRSTDDATFSLSAYHFLTDDYDPTTPRDHQLGSVRRKFNGLDEMRESADRARTFWDNYWKLDRILDNLEVSTLLSERERLQVELHYSLLSGFVHATGYGYGTVQGRTIAAPVPPSYDHYLSELVLLYVIRLAVEELRHIKRAFEKPPAVGLRDWATIALDLDQADKVSEHFWFLGASGPHLYDRVMSVDDEMFVQSEGQSARLIALKTLDPMSLTLDQIRYDPNPLDRLVKMHADHRELTTGTVYRSPFPRADARFR